MLSMHLVIKSTQIIKSNMNTCKNKLVPKLMQSFVARHSKNATMKSIKKSTKNSKSTSKNKNKNKNKNKKPMTRKQKAQQTRFLVNTFCNPKCSGTTFQEDLDFDAFAAKMCQDLGCNKKDTAAMLKKARKEMLKGQPKMLKDDFYHAFDAKTKKRLLQNGALSGCIVGTDLM